METVPAILPQPAWHPMLPRLSELEIERLLGLRDGEKLYLDWYRQHEAAIARADWRETDFMNCNLLRDGFDLPHWRDTDYLLGLGPRTPESLAAAAEAWRVTPYVHTFGPELRQAVARLSDILRRLEELFYIWIGLGGNRSGKSEYCAKQTVRSALDHPSTLIACLSEDIESSRVTQQMLIWKYLPPEIKGLNNTKDRRGIYNVRYSVKGGFTEEQLVLPNGSRILFKTYSMDPGSIEGWTLGSRTGRAVGMWMDESASTGWFEVGKRRCRYCGAVLLWSFTPVKGITPAVKEAAGTAQTLISLPAELLSPEQRHVADCPPGHMPYLARARTEGAIVQYFFSQFNPFGTHAGTFYEAVKSLCRNDDGSPKASVHVRRLAYGYTEDTTGRKFPAFDAVHVVKVANLPGQASVYQYTDPHGSRPYATIWVLVAPGNPPTYYVVRDWPDERTYGEWAVPTTRETTEETRKGWDGDPGPAQRELGWGVIQYKKEWRKAESVRVPEPCMEFLREARGLAVWNDPRWAELLTRKVRYPWHRRIIQAAVMKNHPLDDIRETVIERSMDSRFCNAKHAADHGGTCLKWQFEEEQHDATGTIGAMEITEASGKDIEHGCGLITDLLAYDKDKELVPGINAPRLYVSEECTQVRWALENYTGRSGESGASKEWIDLLRHLAEAAPVFVRTGTLGPRAVGASYG